MSRTPRIVIEHDTAAQRHCVWVEWSRRNRSMLAVVKNAEEALSAAGRARVDWSAPPVIEREVAR